MPRKILARYLHNCSLNKQCFAKTFLAYPRLSFFSSPRWSRIFYLKTFWFFFLCVVAQIPTKAALEDLNEIQKVFFCKFSSLPNWEKGYFIKRKLEKGSAAREERYDKTKFQAEESLIFVFRLGVGEEEGRDWCGGRTKSFLITEISGKVNQKIWWKSRVFWHQKQIKSGNV